MKSPRFSKLRVENLEERTLLAVVAGGFEQVAEFAAPTEAQTWVVNTLEDPTEWDTTDEVLSLREAIDHSADGDRIIFDELLAGGRIVLLDGLEIGKGITIDASGVGEITVDGNQKWTCFTISADQTEKSVELIGLTITNGNFGQGGGIDFFGGTLNLTNCIITKNNANSNGGGIYNSGTLTLTNCTISGNSAGYGGGIYNSYDSTLTLTSCTVSENTATGYGGGIFNGGTLIIMDCTVSRNSSSSSYDSCGGGIHNGGIITLTNCTVSGNTASRRGGGIYNGSSGTLTVTDCIVTGNTVFSLMSSYGGGIYNEHGTLTLTDCIVLENTASSCYGSLGGGIYNGSSTLTLTNCTVSGNTAYSFDNPSSYGGGIYNNDSGTFYVYNTIIAQNIADDLGNDVYCSTGSIYAYNTLSSFTNWTESKDCFVYDSSEPLFHAGNGSCFLSANSQAINKGNNIYISDCDTDISGNPRIVGGTVDIGAHEYQEEINFEIPSTVVTTNIDVADPYDNLISLREAILYATVGDTITFDTSLMWQTIRLSGAELRIDKGITIDASIIGGITIDADSKSRVFSISVEMTEIPVELIGLTITGGLTNTSGAGINNNSSVLTLMNCTISGNTVSGNYGRGGGIFNGDGILTLTNCTVSGNTVSSTVSSSSNFLFGGGIFNGSGTLTLMNCMVSGNAVSSTASSNTYTLGGGIYSDGGTLTMTHCMVSENTASSPLNSRGGGICNWGTLIMTDCTVLGNTSSKIRPSSFINDYSLGGGIFNVGTLIMTDSTVSGNSSMSPYSYDYCASDGGGIYNASGTLTLTNCTVMGNTSCALGGGIYNNEGTLTLINCIVSGNISYYGGGIYNASGTLTMTDCTFSENKASPFSSSPYQSNHSGGGICNDSGVLRMTNCIVSRNTAFSYLDSYGGGISNYSGTLTMVNCAVSGNCVSYTNSSSSSSYGGGIYNGEGTLAMINCTVAGNISHIPSFITNSCCSYGGGIYNESGNFYVCNTIIAQNVAHYYDFYDYYGDNNYGNDVYCNAGSLYAYNTLSSYTGWTESENCLVYNSSLPLFRDAENGGYSLAENSQAINKGNNSYVETEVDLAGNKRIANGIVDLGAYEYGSPPPAEQLASPTILIGNKGVYVSAGANRHQITWDAIENAIGYELTYTSDNRDGWTSVITTETSAVITGLTYGDEVSYRVRALGEGSFADSEWSEGKTFVVCPMDVSGDGDIGGLDRNILAVSWGAEEGEDEYQYYADINADGDVGGLDRNYLGQNWGAEAGDDDLVYPRPLAADMVFAEFASADLGVDLVMF